MNEVSDITKVEYAKAYRVSMAEHSQYSPLIIMGDEVTEGRGLMPELSDMAENGVDIDDPKVRFIAAIVSTRIIHVNDIGKNITGVGVAIVDNVHPMLIASSMVAAQQVMPVPERADLFTVIVPVVPRYAVELGIVEDVADYDVLNNPHLLVQTHAITGVIQSQIVATKDGLPDESAGLIDTESLFPHTFIPHMWSDIPRVMVDSFGENYVRLDEETDGFAEALASFVRQMGDSDSAKEFNDLIEKFLSEEDSDGVDTESDKQETKKG